MNERDDDGWCKLGIDEWEGGYRGSRDIDPKVKPCIR